MSTSLSPKTRKAVSSRRGRRSPVYRLTRRYLPALEVLEDRTLLTAALPPAPVNPLATNTFVPNLTALMQQYSLPEASLAVANSVANNGQPFTQQVINSQYYASNGLAVPSSSTLSANSLFRISTITHTLTAAAVMKMVQDGTLSLDASPFQLLGFTPGEVISGNNPVTGQPVAATLNPALFNITVAELLDMTSGFQNNIPRASSSFPNEGSGDPMSAAGSYAALAFDSSLTPPYTAPADVNQIINYVLYEVSSNPDLLTPPGTAEAFNNFGYAVLGEIVAKLNNPNEADAVSFNQFLFSNILSPLGIQPASNSTGALRMGLGNTLQSEAYPGEVQYYSSSPYAYSVFPSSTAVQPPFYPATQVPQPYGGSFYTGSNFATLAYVATPSAIATLFQSLSDAYEGSTSGPLSPETVRMMVAEPTVPGTGQLPTNDTSTYWNGFGLQVEPGQSTGQLTWFQSGTMQGSSAWAEREADGTVWVAAFNAEPGTTTTVNNAFFTALRDLMTDATAQPRQISAVRNGPPTTLFEVTTNHALWRYEDGSGWTEVGAPGTIQLVSAVYQQLHYPSNVPGAVVAFAVTTDDGLAMLGPDGWQTLGAPGTVQSVSAGLDSAGLADAWVLTTGTALTRWSTTGGWLPSPVGAPGTIRSFSASVDGGVYVITTSHAVCAYGASAAQPGWSLVLGPGSAQEVAVSINSANYPTVYLLTEQGTLESVTGPSASPVVLGVGFSSIDAGSTASGLPDVFGIMTGGALYEYSAASGWSQIGGNGTIAGVSATSSGDAFVITTDSSVDQYDSTNGWMELASPVGI